MIKASKNFFSKVAKKPKMELTIRTPYKVLVKDFTDFSRLLTKTQESVLVVQNRTPAAMHILPPGYLKVRTNTQTENFTGDLMHLGGWLVVHPDNTCEVNLIECVEKKDLQPENLGTEDFDTTTDNKYIPKIQKRAYNSFFKNMKA